MQSMFLYNIFLAEICQNLIPGERFSNGIYIASFPGPAQLSVAFSTESWAGPGNEASIYIHTWWWCG